MNEREQRGMELAKRVNIQPVGKGVGKWIVPSASSSEWYTVDLNSNRRRCTCPDWEQRRCKCKHIFAVEYSVRQRVSTETNAQGDTTVTEQVEVTKRTVYRQNWPAYNAAQTGEKSAFQVLLYDLCKGAPDVAQGKGRARLPLSEMIFSAAFKVYSTVSTRRFISDLEDAHAKGYLSKVPHFNTILNYLEAEELTPILHELIKRSGEPLRAVECDFAVDSSGFSGSKFEKWSYVKFNADRKDFVEHQQRTNWLKLHLMCGVKTNIVTSVEISGRNDHDTKFLAPLVDDTAQRFTLKEVSADKAYSSRDNLQAIVRHNAIPFIPFKVNSNGGALAKGEKQS